MYNSFIYFRFLIFFYIYTFIIIYDGLLGFNIWISRIITVNENKSNGINKCVIFLLNLILYKPWIKWNHINREPWYIYYSIIVAPFISTSTTFLQLISDLRRCRRIYCIRHVSVMCCVRTVHHSLAEQFDL